MKQQTGFNSLCWVYLKRLAAFFSFVTAADGQSTVWSTTVGGNGHGYELVISATPLTWTQARDAASSKGGYLATITSPAENTVVKSVSGSGNPWIGGAQMDGSNEPLGGWHWVTGEPFLYANWHAGEPNNSFSGGNENRLQFYSSFGTWNDKVESHPFAFTYSYVVEYEPRLFAICIGQDTSWNGLLHIRGDLGAQAVLARLQGMKAWAPEGAGNPQSVIRFERKSDPLISQVTALAQAMNTRPGDTLVFYYNGHAGSGSTVRWSGGETPKDIITDGSPIPNDDRDEFITDDLNDDDLTAMFSASKWDVVSKVFLMDCCHSGGFWGDAAADAGDLNKLPNAVLLCPCPEEALTYTADFRDMGYWTKEGLLPALGGGLSPFDLRDRINARLAVTSLLYAGRTLPVLDSVGQTSVFSAPNTVLVGSTGVDLGQPVLPNDPPPPLSITKQTNGLAVSWPQSTSGYVLESSVDLVGSNWTQITSGITVDGANRVFLDSPSAGVTARFFRLRK